MVRGSTKKFRAFAALLIGLIFSVGLLLVYSGEKPDGEKPAVGQTVPEKPNIILVLTDDLDVRSLARLRGLEDSLAKKGTSFENAFVADSNCCPSRATTLRGQYTHNHDIRTNFPTNGGYDKFRALNHGGSTIATWLDAGGYRTLLLGKYFNGYDSEEVPPGWDEWYGAFSPLHYYDFRINENGSIKRYKGRKNYLTDVLSDKAAGFIRRNEDGGEPFFMYLAPKAPHNPATPAPRHEDSFSYVERTPRVPSFNEENVEDKPKWVRELPPLGPQKVNELDRLHRKRLQSMLSVEEMMERLISDLKKTGELENTYIFFTSDNGWHMGQHGMYQGKWTAYEEDIRVPLIVRGPGVPAGEKREHLVVNTDLAPTFADLAGVSTPDFVDGRSLAPLLTRETLPKSRWRTAFLVESAENKNLGRPPFEAVRTRRHLYAEYENGNRELYDLQRDPYQLRSLHKTASPQLLGRLQRRLDALRSCRGEACRTAEDGAAGR